MRRKTLWLPAFPLAVVFAALLGGHPAAGEEAYPGGDNPQGASGTEEAFVSCTEWLNCNAESPNYTGLCCRSCEDPQGQREWYCKRLSAEGELGGPSPAGDVALGETTLTGIVTAEGILKADDGHKYTMGGSLLTVEDLQRNMGKKIEVKGTVQEAKGKVRIEVKSYKSMQLGDAESGGALGSCTGWVNCDQRPPNFTGTCCRQCEDKQGEKAWDCKVFSEGEHFDRAEWSKRD